MERLGDYVIEGELGRGGMGVVYAGVGPDRRRVAIKVLTAAGALDPETLLRFQVEARALARLDHPNIVRFVSSGSSGSHPFVVLERVEGEPLSARLARGPLPARQAVTLVAALAGAVHHAHQRSILHRDLKPDNVLVEPDGTPRIVDFGLAKLLESSAGAQRLSRTGDVMGTPLYMAPEQATGAVRDAGPWTDVYGLGALLYACLTGSPPIRGVSLMETLAAVVLQPVAPPSDVVPGLSPALNAICLRCLAKAPAERYPSAASLQAALTEWLAAPEGKARRGLRPGAIAAAFLLLAGAGVGLGWPLARRARTRPQDPQAPPSTSPSAAPTAAQSPPGVASDPAAEARAKAEAEVKFGLTSLGVGQHQAAIRAARQAVGVDPSWSGGWSFLGRALQEGGELAEAVEACSRAIELDPRDSSGWLNRGAARGLLGDLAAALGDISRGLELSPGDTHGLFNRATLRLQLGDLPGALQDLDRLLELAPQDADGWEARAAVLFQLGSWEEAARDFLQVQALQPGDPGSGRNLVHILHDYLLDEPRAAAIATSLLERASLRDDVELLSLHALLLPEVAEQEVTRLLALSPNHALALSARAAARLRAGRRAEAEEDLAAALRQGPCREALLLRARVRADAGDLDGAWADLQQAVQATTPRTAIAAGRLLLEALEQPRAALTVLEPWLTRPQAPAGALALAADAWKALGDRQQAARALERAAERARDPATGELWRREAAALRAGPR